LHRHSPFATDHGTVLCTWWYFSRNETLSIKGEGAQQRSPAICGGNYCKLRF
jgi:hypothetical protein